ncbi:MAG TPA: choice-of-anchor tandem repeat GloVer-containing protein [Steroidobacteraceae bacterium]|nr:choice-of-anchor tandem repeat GloVer-containing protein [Steroidobacteraceae bacterium]
MLSIILSGCGGGGASDGGGGGGGGGTSASCPLPAGSNSGFCGTMTGLPSGQSVTVGVQTSDAGSNELTVSASGSFTITLEDPLTIISTWNVYVRQQPTGTTCTVTNGGTDLTDGGVKTTSVAGIVVTCAPAVYYTVGGSLTGLNSGGQITLQDYDNPDNVTDQLTLTANGTFTFPTALRGGVGSYSVTVPTQPTGLTCTVNNGYGVTITANVVNVSVICLPAPYYTVGGMLTGLGSGGQIMLQNHDSVDGITDHLTLTANGTFTFATSLRGGSGAYDVTVDAQPTGQLCTVSNGVAMPITANVTNVTVTCADDIGGTLTGLNSGGQITLLDNGGDPLVLQTNGAFTFPTLVANGGAYEVTVGSHPVGEGCSVTDGGGTASGPVASVQVACVNVEQVLHSFAGSDGANPEAGLIMDSSGNLYGTTEGGGSVGAGAVFKLAPNGSGGYTESVLYSFTASTDGENPQAGLIMDSSGNLYGTTSGGPTNGYSTVFQLTPNGSGGYSESVLHLFSGGSDGARPQAGLIMNSSGDLFGTTDSGGSIGGGTVFELAPNGGGSYSESILYSFTGGSDGAHPDGALIIDSSGDLYGTTVSGGSGGDGTVFKLAPNGGGYSESILYRFAGGSDGAHPDGALIMDSSGDLYGTTPSGGSGSSGTVFRLAPNGGGYSESILYSFAGGSDGVNPSGDLFMDGAGNLYDTTAGGGNGNSSSVGDGTVFKLAPNGSGGYTESILYSFTGGTDGTLPDAGLIMDGAGNLYGTTEGGNGSDGNVFEINPH